MHSRAALIFVPFVLLTTACGSSGSSPNASGAGAGGSGSPAEGGAGTSLPGAGAGAAGALTGPLTTLPPSQIPPVDPNAVVISNLDSAIINIEAVEGAKDYRAFVQKEGVEILTDPANHVVVNGATIYCAGLRQRSGPALKVPEVMRQIEVADVTEPTEFIVEAIDQLCPFTGLPGVVDMTFKITSPDANPDLLTPVPIVSEATTRAKYGSLIINGHGPAKVPGMPAEPIAPIVLKRWKVMVSPLDAAAAAKRRTSGFFADFTKDDQPKWVSGGENDNDSFHAPPGYGYGYAIYQNEQFAFYATNTVMTKDNHFSIKRGQLQTLLADSDQDTMGALITIPKKPAHFSDGGYLHVTFEGSTNSTSRRYWWLSLCGADKAGQTFAQNGLLTNVISLNSGFFQPDGANPSSAGWNCLVVFPHDGLSTAVPIGASNPQSSVIVLIHKPDAPKLQSAVNVSPQQVNAGYAAAWYRLMKGDKVTDTGILDDLIQVAPASHFDFYISRQRIIMYVNGQQRMCNDFGPQPLTMAEAAVGFNEALYHSSAEHTEMLFDFADRTGQLYYLNNTIYAEPHTWDNLGFEENVALPDSYSDADCYTYKP
ncbi:MAG TPA: hypothetical protein VJV79_34155 [Polyangiaceae bacterium]|nr:hypothetical protein [Polyangiaceae bacterium]